jgi:hypothetical protein
MLPARTPKGLARMTALAVALVCVLASAPAAAAYERPPELERVASIFAMRSAEVRCPSSAEWTSDPIWGGGPRAWGYTNMPYEYVELHPALCAGALAVADATRPPWQRATGVLVLVHEAYHLRQWRWRFNEAKVECQAIRHFTVGARLLGASPPQANDLLPYALAVHARMGRLFPEYLEPGCTLPTWKPPLTP